MIMPRDYFEPESSGEPSLSTLLRSMERYLAGKHAVKDKAAYEAQQLVYDAWEAPTDQEELELMKQALKLDPGSKEEAACFADVLRSAWHAHPEALRWLKAQK